jgi:hypothetical protein
MLNEEDLRELGKHLDEVLKNPPEGTSDEDEQKVRQLRRLLQPIHYNPLIFQDSMREYEYSEILDEMPLDELPLHINDHGLLSEVLVKWRLTKRV